MIYPKLPKLSIKNLLLFFVLLVVSLMVGLVGKLTSSKTLSSSANIANAAECWSAPAPACEGSCDSQSSGPEGSTEAGTGGSAGCDAVSCD
jgi:hypothetical protein